MKQLRLAFQLQLPHVPDAQSAAALARLEAELQAELRRAESDLVRHGHHHALTSESTRGESPYPATPCPHADPSSTAHTAP